MAETMQSLDSSATLKPAAPEAPEIRAEARQAGPRLRHRQAQERGRPRLDQAGLRQDRRQHPAGRGVLCAAGAAHADPAAAGRRQPRRASTT